jgi:uncharacterized protein (TIGR02757 family)
MREFELTEPIDKKALDRLYRKYNRRNFVHPDPLEFLYRYDAPADREIVALIASSLAYGRVKQILASLETVFSKMHAPPGEFAVKEKPAVIRKAFAGFVHRWTKGEDIANLLLGIRGVLQKHGSLRQCFAKHVRKSDETFLPALDAFVADIGSPMLASPCKGSACKRLHLFLRWLVRKDDVDPGGWEQLPKSKLIVPLDTHMHKIGRAFGLTNRKAADGKTAVEITQGFARFAPLDPVKYDFALTRFGIRGELDLDNWLASRKIG